MAHRQLPQAEHSSNQATSSHRWGQARPHLHAARLWKGSPILPNLLAPSTKAAAEPAGGAGRVPPPPPMTPGPRIIRGRPGPTPVAHPASHASDLKELGFAKDFTAKYELTSEHLGAGTFGSVNVAIDRKTGERVAVKSIPKRKLGGWLEQTFVSRIRREVDIYNLLGNSLNVSYLAGAYEDQAMVHLVMELCTGGELWQRIRGGKFTERDAARYVKGILRAVAQCHAKGVIVRDVKPENFLLASSDPQAPLKMVDFGMAEYCPPGKVFSDRAGTPIYVAPEVLKQRYNMKADLWSAGVIAYELLAARLPFQSSNGRALLSHLYLSDMAISQDDVFSAILSSPLDFSSPPWDVISPQARDLVAKLLTREPNKRPTAEQALAHPWLADPNVPSGHVLQLSHKDTLVQRLQRFGTFGRFKQLALRAVTQIIAADKKVLHELTGAFDELDEHGTGRVLHHRVEDMIRSGEFHLSESEIRTLLRPFKQEDGYVDYYEWLAALIDWRELQQHNRQAWEGWVRQAFSQLDHDGNQQLGPADLAEVLCTRGEGCPSDDYVPQMLRQAQAESDAFGDGLGEAIGLKTFEEYLEVKQAERLELFDARKLPPPAPC